MLLLLHMYLVMRIPPVTGTVLVFPGGVVTVPEGVGDPVLTSSVEVVGITVVTAVVRSISHCNGLLCMVQKSERACQVASATPTLHNLISANDVERMYIQ